MVDEEVGYQTTSVCHLGHIATQVGKRLEWVPVKKRFTNSEVANDCIGRPVLAARRG